MGKHPQGVLAHIQQWILGKSLTGKRIIQMGYDDIFIRTAVCRTVRTVVREDGCSK